MKRPRRLNLHLQRPHGPVIDSISNEVADWRAWWARGVVIAFAVFMAASAKRALRAG